MAKTDELKERKKEIATLWAQTEPGTEEYYKYWELWKELDEIDMEHDKLRHAWNISPSQVFQGGVSLLSLGAVLFFESENVIRSKMFGMVARGLERVGLKQS